MFLPGEPPGECWPDPPWWFPLGGLEPVGVVVVVVVVAVVVVDVGEQDAETFLTGPVPGGTSDDGGVPGGALTTKVSVWPVTSVTVTLHWSAEADGIAAMPIVPKAEPATRARICSFRRMDTVVCFPPAGMAMKPCCDAELARYCP